MDSAPSGEGTYFGVTCASSTGCYAAGINGVVASTNGGLTWATQSVPSGTGALSDVACSSPSDCIAVGGVPSGGGSDVILATTDGGTNWASQTAPAGVSDLYGVSCRPPSSECYAVGQSGDNSNPAGAIISSSDGGITWTSQNSPASLSEFGGVDCPDALTCFAVGEGPGTIVATTNGGVDWTDEGVPSGVNKPNAIACPSSSDCYAVGDGNGVDGVILASTNGGSSWSSQAVPVGATDLYGIACPSVSDCTAVGLDEQNETEVILATTDSGATWTSETAPPDLGILTAISCPSPSACFAVGNAVASGLPVVVVTADAGATWTVETVPSTTGNFSSIACASPTDCQAVGVFQESGTNSYFPHLGTTDGGTTWTFESLGENVGTAENLATVACPSVSDCYAIGGIIGGAIEIFATTDGGLYWVDEPLPSGTQYLPVATFGNEGIACPSASVCYADAPAPTSSAVLATIDGGETWTSESLPSDSGSLTTIACPSVSECFAAGLGDSSPDDGGLILSGTDLDPLSVGTASLPTGAVYGPYWASLTAVGGMSPYTWSITSGVLPVGLSLDSTTGSIEGTPTKAGASSLTVGATDSSSPALTATADLTITIERRLAIAKASLPQGITGQSYNGALTASGGLPPYSWSATSLPAGLSIDSSTGFITGTPLTSGKYPVTFGVTSSDNQEVEKSGSPD